MRWLPPLEHEFQGGEPVSAWSGRRLLGDDGDRAVTEAVTGAEVVHQAELSLASVEDVVLEHGVGAAGRRTGVVGRDRLEDLVVRVEPLLARVPQRLTVRQAGLHAVAQAVDEAERPLVAEALAIGDRPSDVFACDHAWPLLGMLAPDQANFFEYCGQSDHLLGRKPPVLVRELSYYLT